VVVAAFLGQATAPAGEAGKDEVLVLVNGEPLTRSRLNRLVEPLMRTRPDPRQAERARRQALGFLVQEIVLAQHMRETGYRPAGKEIAAELDRKRKAYDALLRPGQRSFDEEIAARGGSADGLRKEPTVGMCFSCLVHSRVTDDDARKAFEEDRGVYDGSEVRARHVLVKTAPGAKPEEKEAARKRAEEIRARAAAGEDFGKLAGELSEDEGSRPKGGDVGFFPRKHRMQEPFARAAFALGKDEISQVVESVYGFHVIQATDVKPGKPFADLKEKVREALVRERAESIYKELASKAKLEPPAAPAATPPAAPGAPPRAGP
jgi:hypothetical protein